MVFFFALRTVSTVFLSFIACIQCDSKIFTELKKVSSLQILIFIFNLCIMVVSALVFFTFRSL